MIAEKFEEYLQNKCLKEPNAYFVNEEDVFTPSLPERAECIVGALAEASSLNGMTNEWKKFQPEIRDRLDAWKKCSNYDEKLYILVYVPIQIN